MGSPTRKGGATRARGENTARGREVRMQDPWLFIQTISCGHPRALPSPTGSDIQGTGDRTPGRPSLYQKSGRAVKNTRVGGEAWKSTRGGGGRGGSGELRCIPSQLDWTHQATQAGSDGAHGNGELEEVGPVRWSLTHSGTIWQPGHMRPRLNRHARPHHARSGERRRRRRGEGDRGDPKRISAHHPGNLHGHGLSPWSLRDGSVVRNAHGKA
ncbi:unnamed protein product [Prorocentrum cordatum]|uniref:Uncharacterized protein n=1 Tax=Prorocentrum cordatum TaxID=2364126 RepID=A0ABN9WBW1_9DINO|nr:unnamed protein product [Polarella glacialis]